MMSTTSHTRRRILQLAAAAPALAAGAWFHPGDQSTVRTPDGRWQLLGAPDGIHWASADGRQRGLFLPLGTSYVLIPGSIAPQGGHLAYSALDRRTGSSIWTVSVQPGDAGPVAGRPVAFFHSGAFDVEPRFSEDGRRLAYASLEAGSWKLRVRRFA